MHRAFSNELRGYEGRDLTCRGWMSDLPICRSNDDDDDDELASNDDEEPLASWTDVLKP